MFVPDLVSQRWQAPARFAKVNHVVQNPAVVGQFKKSTSGVSIQNEKGELLRPEPKDVFGNVRRDASRKRCPV
jgi:hypothetical protein